MVVETIKQLAQELGVPALRLRKHLAAGRIQPERDGGYDPARVSAMLDRADGKSVAAKTHRTLSTHVAGPLLIEQWPISQPKPYPRNARKWSPRAIETVAASIREYGFRQPIVVDAAGVIIIGHLRLAAAKSLGLTHVPVHVARDLTPSRVRGLRLADNRTSEESSWDRDLLGAEFLELKDIGFDLSLTAFDDQELRSFLVDEPAPSAREDAGTIQETPETGAGSPASAPDATPVSRPGDLWLAGDVGAPLDTPRSADGMAGLCGPNGTALVGVPADMDALVQEFERHTGRSVILAGDGRTFREIQIFRGA